MIPKPFDPLTARELLEGLMNHHTVKFVCPECGSTYERTRKYIVCHALYHKKSRLFCSPKCSQAVQSREFEAERIKGDCGYCESPLSQIRSDYVKKKHGLMFCSQSCAAKFMNVLAPKKRPGPPVPKRLQKALALVPEGYRVAYKQGTYCLVRGRERKPVLN